MKPGLTPGRNPIPVVSWKVCTKCGVKKSKALFHHSSRHKDGLNAQCKACTNAVARARKPNYFNSTRFPV